jgi:hypothetical protein
MTHLAIPYASASKYAPYAFLRSYIPFPGFLYPVYQSWLPFFNYVVDPGLLPLFLQSIVVIIPPQWPAIAAAVFNCHHTEL